MLALGNATIDASDLRDQSRVRVSSPCGRGQAVKCHRPVAKADDPANGSRKVEVSPIHRQGEAATGLASVHMSASPSGHPLIAPVRTPLVK